MNRSLSTAGRRRRSPSPRRPCCTTSAPPWTCVCPAHGTSTRAGSLRAGPGTGRGTPRGALARYQGAACSRHRGAGEAGGGVVGERRPPLGADDVGTPNGVVGEDVAGGAGKGSAVGQRPGLRQGEEGGVVRLGVGGIGVGVEPCPARPPQRRRSMRNTFAGPSRGRRSRRAAPPPLRRKTRRSPLWSPHRQPGAGRGLDQARRPQCAGEAAPAALGGLTDLEALGIRQAGGALCSGG